MGRDIVCLMNTRISVVYQVYLNEDENDVTRKKFGGCGGCNFADRKELWVVIPVASQRFPAWVPASNSPAVRPAAESVVGLCRRPNMGPAFIGRATRALFYPQPILRARALLFLACLPWDQASRSDQRPD
jgi:hypothetical protein